MFDRATSRLRRLAPVLMLVTTACHGAGGERDAPRDEAAMEAPGATPDDATAGRPLESNPLVAEVRRTLRRDDEAAGEASIENELERRLIELKQSLERDTDGSLVERSSRRLRERDGALERFLHGRLLQMTGQDREAIEEFRRALALDPDYYPAHEAIAAEEERIGNLEAAVSELERALETVPANSRARLALARIHYRAFHYDLALRELDRIPETDPLAATAALLRGQTLAESERYAEAEEVLRKAAVEAADPIDAWYLLAAVHVAAGHREEAAFIYERIVTLRPRETRALFLLGRTLVDLGRTEESVLVLERLLASLPADSGVDREELRRLIDGLATDSGELSPELREVRDLAGRAMSNTDPAVRLAALRRLSTTVAIRSPGILPVYREALRDPDPAVRIVAIQELSRRAGADALPDLLHLLDPAAASPPEVVAILVQEIGGMGDLAAVPHLLPLLRSPDLYVSGEARRALARLAGRSFYHGLAPDPPEEERGRIAGEWEAWWRGQGDVRH